MMCNIKYDLNQLRACGQGTCARIQPWVPECPRLFLSPREGISQTQEGTQIIESSGQMCDDQRKNAYWPLTKKEKDKTVVS